MSFHSWSGGIVGESLDLATSHAFDNNAPNFRVSGEASNWSERVVGANPTTSAKSGGDGREVHAATAARHLVMDSKTMRHVEPVVAGVTSKPKIKSGGRYFARTADTNLLMSDFISMQGNPFILATSNPGELEVLGLASVEAFGLQRAHASLS